MKKLLISLTLALVFAGTVFAQAQNISILPTKTLTNTKAQNLSNTASLLPYITPAYVPNFAGNTSYLGFVDQNMRNTSIYQNAFLIRVNKNLLISPYAGVGMNFYLPSLAYSAGLTLYVPQFLIGLAYYGSTPLSGSSSQNQNIGQFQFSWYGNPNFHLSNVYKIGQILTHRNILNHDSLMNYSAVGSMSDTLTFGFSIASVNYTGIAKQPANFYVGLTLAPFIQYYWQKKQINAGIQGSIPMVFYKDANFSISADPQATLSSVLGDQKKSPYQFLLSIQNMTGFQDLTGNIQEKTQSMLFASVNPVIRYYFLNLLGNTFMNKNLYLVGGANINFLLNFSNSLNNVITFTGYGGIGIRYSPGQYLDLRVGYANGPSSSGIVISIMNGHSIV